MFLCDVYLQFSELKQIKYTHTHRLPQKAHEKI